MKSFREEQIVRKEADAIICNMCGESIKKNQFGYFHEHLSVKKEWGYGSSHDGETHSFDICAECYEQLLKAMKIAPEE